MSSSKAEVLLGLRLLRETVLRAVADSCAARLASWRLAPVTTGRYLGAMAHFARWLASDPRRTYPPVHEGDVDEFLTVHLLRCRCPGRVPRSVGDARSALRHLNQVVRAQGLYVELPSRRPSPVDREVERFDCYLRDVCGLAEQTRLHRTRHVREFLVYLFNGGSVRHRQILPHTFGSFLTVRAHLDAYGEWTFEVLVPPGLVGSEFGIRSYSRRTRVVNPNAVPPGAPFVAKAPPSMQREVVMADSGLELVVVE